MFTGIIEATAALTERTDFQLTVERPALFDDIAIGTSISVSGACLSVIAFDDRTMQFDVVPETWQKTKLGSLTIGDRVNLERALKADGRFEGHIVQGHVDGVGKVKQCHSPSINSGGTEVVDSDYRLVIAVPTDLTAYIVVKGSIALDGVSLTVAAVDNDHITVALIPHTLENTTLGELQAGDPVNIETDILGKYVRKRS